MKTKECIAYLGEVLQGLTEIPENKKQYYADMLNKIKQRENNPNLNVAIIGDFSSGKSTFINAFLQKDILKTAWLATTAIPTHILYHDKEKTNIIVRGNDGQEYNLSKIGDRTSLEKKLSISLSGDDKSVIATLSATNDYEGKISEIFLYVSSFKELKKICIIDTPGVNPGDEAAREHIKQTQSVLREYADSTIVLFQSTRVLTNSFNLFLEENAGHFMDEAIFVITMMDIPNEDEREEILNYARNGIKERFHINNPKLFSCSAMYAEASRHDKENEHWRQEFDSLRNSIINHMRKRRTKIIERQISKLLRQLIEELKEEIEFNSALIEEQLDILNSNSIENLRGGMNSNYSIYSKRLNQTWESIGFERRYNAMFDSIIASARGSLNECQKIRGDDIRSITGYMSNYLPHTIKYNQESFSKELTLAMTPVNAILSDYYKENEQIFKQFSINIGRSDKADDKDISKVNYDNDIGNVNYVDESIVEILGGLAGVAVALPFMVVDGLLGTEISDAIVNAVDGIRNGLVNMFADLSGRKRKVIATVENSMKSKRDENRTAFLNSIKESKAKIDQSMKNIEKEFSKKYRSIYSERKMKFEAEKENLEGKIKYNTETLEKLEKYLGQLK